MESARIYSLHTGAVVADFRREYSLSWSALLSLAANEFAILLNGLSSNARVVGEVRSAAATVQAVEPQTLDDFIERIQRHPRAVVEVVSRGR